jgi:hypothetical protein
MHKFRASAERMSRHPLKVVITVYLTNDRKKQEAIPGNFRPVQLITSTCAHPRTAGGPSQTGPRLCAPHQPQHVRKSNRLEPSHPPGDANPLRLAVAAQSRSGFAHRGD